MCRFPNIYFVWHRFVRISLHLIEGLQYSKRTSCPVCSQVYWRMRAEPSCGLNVLFSLLLMASGLSARSHSASSHLLRTKKGLLGVHAAKLHSKGIGQTPASCCLSSKYLLFFLFNAIITKAPLPHPLKTACHLKRCETALYCYIFDIFMLQNCYLTGWWLISFISLEQLNACLPHVSCVASFQNGFCQCLRLGFCF